MGDHLDAAGVVAGDRGERLPHAEHPLGGGVDGEAVGLGVMHRQAGPRLEGRAGQALAVHAQGGGVGGPGEGGIGRGGVAGLVDHADIAGHGLVHQRGAGGECRIQRGDRGQVLVVDGDQFGGVLRGAGGVGDHHRDGLPDEADLVGGEDGQLTLDLGLAVGTGDRRPARDGLEAGLGDIEGGEHGDHAGGLAGGRAVHAQQPGMGTIGSDHGGVQLTGQVPVGGVAALAGDQAPVFVAGGRQPTGARIDIHAHWAPPSAAASRPAAVRTASTMFT